MTISAAVAALGCGDDAEESDAGGSGTPDGGYPMVPCPEDLPDFVTGWQVLGEDGLIQAELLDAQYFPPRQYRNDWTIAFQDADGEPLDDVEITMARSFMPAHMHDGRRPPVLTALEAPGEFQVDDINMWMPGPWEVQFQASSAAAGDDYIVFDVCIR